MDGRRPERTCRRGATLLVPLAVGVLCSVGCQQRDSGNYSSYDELTPQTKDVASSRATTTQADPHPSSASMPTGGSETGAKTAADTSTAPGLVETAPPVEPSAAAPGPGTVLVAPADVPLEPQFAGAETPAPTADSARPADGPRGPNGTDPTVRSAPGAPVVANEPPPAPREIKLLVAERDFQTEGPRDALRVSFDDFDLLKILNMEPVPVDAAEHMPGWLKGLDGRVVRVRGFMYPSFEETGLEQFILARDNQICCFGRDPKIYDLVHVKMKAGVTTRYIPNRPFDVVGVFRIKPADLDGRLAQLYKIEDATVIEK